MPSLADLLNMGKNYVKDSLPGGLLNHEVNTQGILDGAALSTTAVPVLGDLLGLGADLNRYKNEPESRTLGNFALSGLGMLPFVPAMTSVVGPRHSAMETARKNAVEMLGLPESNTAMDRAKAMGAEFGWAHGSDNPNITTLKSSKIGAEGPGAYATNYLPESNTYAQSAEGATVYPLAVFKDKTLNSGTANPYELLGAADDVELAAKLKQMGKDSIIRTQQATPQWLIDAGGLPMPAREHYVSTNPANFRSRFAAFDPARRHEADLLGRATPEMLGVTTLGGLLGLEAMRRNQE